MSVAVPSEYRAEASVSLLRILAVESRYELVKQLRQPLFALPTLAFPVLFYALFALALQRPGSAAPTYLLATYGVFGVIGTALFGFGVGCAVERGQGWLLLKQASAMPPSAYLVAKLAMCVSFGAIVVSALAALAAAAGDVRLTLPQWLLLAAVLLLGTLPAGALGLALSFLLGPNSAPAVLNLIYLPLSFASGLWLPISMLPDFFQRLAPWLPFYHQGQLALSVVGLHEGGSPLVHLLFLLAFTVLCLALAPVLYRRAGDDSWG